MLLSSLSSVTAFTFAGYVPTCTLAKSFNQAGASSAPNADNATSARDSLIPTTRASLLQQRQHMVILFLYEVENGLHRRVILSWNQQEPILAPGESPRIDDFSVIRCQPHLHVIITHIAKFGRLRSAGFVQLPTFGQLDRHLVV